MNDNDSDNSFYKSIWFCLTCAFLGTLFFLYKADACGMGSGCHDTIHLGNSPTSNCDVGAVMESLPDGRFICHCVQPVDAGK